MISKIFQKVGEKNSELGCMLDELLMVMGVVICAVIMLVVTEVGIGLLSDFFQKLEKQFQILAVYCNSGVGGGCVCNNCCSLK